MATMRITDPPERLDTHILRSYSVLRWCMGVFGFMLPLLLVVGGINSLWWISAPLEIQNSLSAYYHAGSTCTAFDGVYRDLFVGILAAISFCLIIYTGFGGWSPYSFSVSRQMRWLRSWSCQVGIARPSSRLMRLATKCVCRCFVSSWTAQNH